MVSAKVAGPQNFEPIHFDGKIIEVVFETKHGVDYQKVVASSLKPLPNGEKAQKRKTLWTFVPPLPQAKPIDKSLEEDVQVPRVFFNCFKRSGAVISVCVIDPPYMQYNLDSNTGKVLEVVPWRTTEPAR